MWETIQSIDVSFGKQCTKFERAIWMGIPSRIGKLKKCLLFYETFSIFFRKSFIYVWFTVGMYLPYLRHHNPSLIINRSWTLTIHKGILYWKFSLKKRFWPSKSGFKIYKPRVIMTRVRYMDINHFQSSKLNYSV